MLPWPPRLAGGLNTSISALMADPVAFSSGGDQRAPVGQQRVRRVPAGMPPSGLGRPRLRPRIEGTDEAKALVLHPPRGASAEVPTGGQQLPVGRASE